MPENINLNQAELIIAIVGLAWSLMGLVNLTRNPVHHKKSIHWAIGLILSMSIPFIGIIMQQSVHLRIPIISPLFSNHSMPLLYGPFFYFYIMEVLGELKWDTRRMWNFFPFVLVFATELLASQGPRWSLSVAFRLAHSSLTAVSVMAYGFWTIRRIRIADRRVDNHFSSRETDITLSWARYLGYGYIAVFGLSFLSLFIAAAARTGSGLLTPFWITTLPLVLFIFEFCYFAPGQRIIRTDRSVDEEIRADRNKYEKSAFDINELKPLAAELDDYMRTARSYLDPDLTLEKLAGLSGVSRHKISQIINICFNRSFYSFINDYRIRYLSEKINQQRHHEISMLGLAFECGFKSSSSFYSAVKKEVGMTPKELVRSLESEAIRTG